MNGSKTETIQIQCRCSHLTNFAVLVVMIINKVMLSVFTGHYACFIVGHIRQNCSTQNITSSTPRNRNHIHNWNITVPTWSSGYSHNTFMHKVSALSLIQCVNFITLEIERFDTRMSPNTIYSCVVPSLACCWYL
mgnify:CR=1 FL=1